MAHWGSLSKWSIFALLGAALAVASCDRPGAPEAADSGGAAPAVFQTSDVYPEASTARPWTHLNFLDNPEDFAPGAEFCGPQYGIPCISTPRS